MNVAAFFDIDGTLLPPPSLERQFRRFVRWRGELGVRQQFRSLGHFLAAVWHDPIAATHGNKVHYAGARLTTMQAWISFLRRHPPPFHSQALDRVAWHAQQGHRIVLVSGTIQPLAHLVAELLRTRLSALTEAPVHLDVLAAELEVRNGHFTGSLVGPAICGAQKASAIEAYAVARSLNLAESFAYGNSILDGWMLSRVGRATAVNPSFLLAWLARRCNWPVVRWSDTAGARRNTASVLQTNPANMV